MKKHVGAVTVVMSILVLLLASESLAQRGMGWKGSGACWGMGRPMLEFMTRKPPRPSAERLSAWRESPRGWGCPTVSTSGAGIVH